MEDHLITWPRLTRGRLIRRFKRFMAEVLLAGGETIIAHCPNSGCMLACSEPGRPVFLSRSENPLRKFPYTLEMIEMPGSLVVVNTLRANTVVRSAIEQGLIPELSGYSRIRAEVPYGAHSRIDLLLQGDTEKPCLVEVKSSTLVEDGVARFPDAVTDRGLKHLKELQKAYCQGYRCMMFFLIQRMDAHAFESARHIDPVYGLALSAARLHGIEVITYDTRISLSGLDLGRRIPIIF
jgi:sugar fermentation stimulation protein A